MCKIDFPLVLQWKPYMYILSNVCLCTPDSPVATLSIGDEVSDNYRMMAENFKS